MGALRLSNILEQVEVLSLGLEIGWCPVISKIQVLYRILHAYTLFFNLIFRMK